MITAMVVVEDDGFHIIKTIDLTRKDRTIPIVVEYLAEGGANVVLRLVPFARASRMQCPPELQNKLLRMRKDKAFLSSVKDQQRGFDETIVPLFSPENLVAPRLVTVDRAFLEATNAELAQLQSDGLRPDRRDGDRVAESEEYAVLMTDMSPIGIETSIEIKPKWLAQSPDAPPGAKRCRTCALRAQRASIGRLSAKQAGQEAFCPLALMSDDHDAHMLAAKGILKANNITWMSNGEEELSKLMPTTLRPILEKIRDHQVKNDPHGILSLKENEQPSAQYLLSMTLRDCALFMRTPKALRLGPIEIRLADLDAKLPHPEKMQRWRETERTLIYQGWYENKAQGSAPEEICLLSRGTA